MSVLFYQYFVLIRLSITDAYHEYNLESSFADLMQAWPKSRESKILKDRTDGLSWKVWNKLAIYGA